METLYIVFSATQYKTGGFIRTVTRGEYNHVSVAFDPALNEVYSFGRLALHAPFCGGFVREGSERFLSGKRRSQIAVCAVRIDGEHMRAVRGRLAEMLESGPEKYVYNMLSAACVPIRRRVRIRDCYTCVEFAVSLLMTAGLPLDDSYHSITELYRLLSTGEIYRGEFPDGGAVTDASYFDEIPVLVCVRMTTRQLWRMAYRLINR